jgi:hypothetical protein
LHFLNEESTVLVKDDEKFRAYKEWAIKNGIQLEKIEFPVQFGRNGILRGSAAAQNIEAGDFIIEVPESCVIHRTAVYQSELRPLMDKHPEIFDKHKEADLALVIFALYEKMKGIESKWYPYLEIQEYVDLPAFWPDELINEFQD